MGGEWQRAAVVTNGASGTSEWVAFQDVDGNFGVGEIHYRHGEDWLIEGDDQIYPRYLIHSICLIPPPRLLYGVS